jgi:hypothetical protein
MNGENANWKEMTVAYFKILSWDYTSENEGNYEKPCHRTS